MDFPKRFVLFRDQDVTGVSGEGVVANGVEFPGGTAVMKWCVPGKPNSLTVYDSLADVLEIHGHDGRTWVNMYDGDDIDPTVEYDTWVQALKSVA